MRIARICYPVTVLGPGKRVGIWVTGCDKNCTDCMSQELRDPNRGEDIDVDYLFEMIKSVDHCDGITISGGEPFLQINDLIRLIDIVSDYVDKDIIIYTGYTMDEIKERWPKDFDIIV